MSPSKKADLVQTPPPALIRALRRTLRPIVRLWLRHHLTHPDLSGLLKSIFVEVAREELSETNEKETASRISLLTGVHRKDLRRLLAESPADASAPAAVSLGARLVRAWMSDARFLDARGRPRSLSRSPQDSEAGFDDLVESISSDVRPRTVLDEWLRIGIAQVDSTDRVQLRVEGFVPTDGFEEKAHYFGRNLHDHIAAAAQNLSGDAAPTLDRSVHYEGLSDAALEELAVLSEELGMSAMREVDRRAQALQRRDAGQKTKNEPRDPRGRMNFGVYFYRELGKHSDD